MNNNQTLRSQADQKNMTVGAAVKVNRLRDDKQYRETVAREFNSITAEYEMKFQFMQPEKGKFNFRDSDELMDFAQENNMDLRGHALVWHISNPEWLEKGDWSRQELLNILETHIKTVVGRYKGKIKSWDVVNEAVGDDGKLRNSFWLEKIGPEYIELAFKWAHEADPNAKLLYNDYRAEEVNKKSNRVYELVSDLTSKGIPIHGVGFQMHMSEDDPRNFKSVADNMERLGDLGLEVQFTEADVRVKQPMTAAKQANQARIYQEIVETCAEADNCNSVTVWGVTDRYSWIPGFFKGYDDALPFDENYRPKEAFKGLLSGFEDAAVQKDIPAPGKRSKTTPTPEPESKKPLPELEGDIIETPETPQNEESNDAPNNNTDIENEQDSIGGNNNNTKNKTKDYDVVAGDGNDFIRLDNDQNSVHAGNGNNKIYVGQSNNSKTITAGTGNDRALAGNGDDYIDLGTAETRDVAFGRGGRDTFVLNQGSGSLTIRDFTQGTDKLALNGLNFEDIQQESKNGKVWISAGGDRLAKLTNFTGTLTEKDFVSPDAKLNQTRPENNGQQNSTDATEDLKVVETPTGDSSKKTGNPKTGGYDVVTGNGNDFIQLSKGQKSVNAGNGDNKIYVGSDNNSDIDILTGTGNDKVHGGSGNDRFDLGTAKSQDVVFGRGGNDTFVLNQGSGRLMIRDFEQGIDQLELSDGISFGAIDQTSRNGKTWLSAGGDVLAELTNFSGTLTTEDFTTAS
ncbi:MAG: endo-1,4-beta-xylanase [Cyanobacteria bacterium J06642_11]